MDGDRFPKQVMDRIDISKKMKEKKTKNNMGDGRRLRGI